MELKGSCCCGAVQFVIDERPTMMGKCHCSRCRKLGTSTMVFVKREQFRLVSGADDIQTVEPEPPYKYVRSYCRSCGTSLGEPLSKDDTFPINAHCLDDDPGIRTSFHEFVAEKPEWAPGPQDEKA
ncbi:Glutathione-dependent formaldehyde-activating enzyme [Labrenzia sp. THAF82]|nr:Glutathione-dependent formaldehyde-activating enzyme [Labrenzia sp. THAF82]